MDGGGNLFPGGSGGGGGYYPGGNVGGAGGYYPGDSGFYPGGPNPGDSGTYGPPGTDLPRNRVSFSIAIHLTNCGLWVYEN